MVKIIVDTVGGDHSPDVNVQGALMALEKYDDLQIIFVGKEEVIRETIGDAWKDARMQIVDAREEITCHDTPTTAIRTKKESSLCKAFDTLKSNDDVCAMVSNGSTGAIIAGAVMKLGRIKGVKRPALCPILPTVTGNIVTICDTGATVECDSEMLCQFATMASMYMEKAFCVQKPRVALLNVGVEAEKGDAMRKETYKALSERTDINFVGNMESRDLLSGKYDVVVSDGFSGNVLCKATEGACLEAVRLVGKMLAKNREAAALLQKDVQELRAFMDYNNYGGAVLLGAAKTIVKAHGSSEAVTILRSIEQAYDIEKGKLNEEIEGLFSA